MTVIGAYEAKTHLPKLIEKVTGGETVQITRHGVPVANLVPVEKQTLAAEVVRDLRSFRKGKKLTDISIRDLISDGRE